MNSTLSMKEKFKFGSPLYSDILNIVFIVYTFLLPFSKAFPIFTGPYVILLFWILEGNFSEKYKKIRSSKVILYILVFYAFSTLSLFWSDNTHEGRQLLRYYFAISMVMVAIFTSMKQKFAKSILYAFLLSMLISEIASYGIYFEWWHINGVPPSMPTPFMHHTIYSVFLATTIFLLLAQIQDKSTPFKLRIFEFIFFLSSSINLFINGGRTGQLALIFGAFAYTFIYFKKKIFIFYTFVLLAFIFVGAYQLSPNFHNRVHQAVNDIEKIQKGNLKSSWGSRIAMKQVAWQIIKDQPVLGVGIGDSMDVFREYLDHKQFHNLNFIKVAHHLHDQFIQIMVDTGIIGLFIFLLFLFSLLATVFHMQNPLLQASLFSIVTIFLFAFFTDVPLKNLTGGLFAFVIGYLLNQSKNFPKVKTGIE
jgi:O-antigen ligase